MDEVVDLAQLAATCEDYVKRAVGVALDGTQDTLPILDHYVREATRGVSVAGSSSEAPAGDGATANHPGAAGDSAALLGPLVPATGAYFGQLVLKQFAGARFIAHGQDYASYRIEFGPYFLHFNPMGIAHEVITGEDAPGYHAHFAVLDEARPVVEQSLASGLTVRTQDYYSFSVRHETLEQVVAVLSALEEQRRGPARHFPTEVYDSAIGGLAAAKG